jgi:hypothetical protein
MEDNYLWDGSGEPDPQIQELEQILGKLRYQPQPLEIPKQGAIGHRRSFSSTMAIAAAIGLVAVMIGLWFYFQQARVMTEQAKTNQPIEQKANKPPEALGIQEVAPVSKPANVQTHRDTSPTLSRTLLAANKIRRPRPEIPQPRLTPEELAEKEQLLAALRLVSAKLNVAQRKTQGSPLNAIRNQHRIG